MSITRKIISRLSTSQRRAILRKLLALQLWAARKGSDHAYRQRIRALDKARKAFFAMDRMQNAAYRAMVIRAELNRAEAHEKVVAAQQRIDSIKASIPGITERAQQEIAGAKATIKELQAERLAAVRERDAA